MNTLYTDVIQKSPLYTSVELVSSLEMLEPTFRQKIQSLIAEAATQGHELMVFETFRSQVRQHQLFLEKKTKLPTVGVHHYGLAADIVFNVNGKPTWPSDEDFKILGPLARAQELIWGGDWGEPQDHNTFPDMDHSQWCSLERQQMLFHEQWYPVAGYNPYQDSAV